VLIKPQTSRDIPSRDMSSIVSTRISHCSLHVIGSTSSAHHNIAKSHSSITSSYVSWQCDTARVCCWMPRDAVVPGGLLQPCSESGFFSQLWCREHFLSVQGTKCRGLPSVHGLGPPSPGSPSLWAYDPILKGFPLIPQSPPLLPAMWPYSVGLLDGIHARIVRS